MNAGGGAICLLGGGILLWKPGPACKACPPPGGGGGEAIAGETIYMSEKIENNERIFFILTPPIS